MENKDPLQKVEQIVKSVHDNTSKYTSPVLHKYPLLFAFLVIFSAVAIMNGFNTLVDNITYFNENPVVLILIGVTILALTGKLYKWLEKTTGNI